MSDGLTGGDAGIFTPASLVFSAGIRSAIGTFYRARLAGRVAGFAEMLDAYDRHWAKATAADNPPVHFTDQIEDADVMLNLASRMIAAFFADARPGEVIAVDEPFIVTLAPDLPPISGRIDLIERRIDADGIRRLHLVDYKLSARRSAKDDLDFDLFPLFALVGEQAGWADTIGLPLALRVDVIAKSRTLELANVPATSVRHKVDRLVERIRQCDRSMKSGVRFPAPSWSCLSCGFSELCALWPERPPTQTQ